MSYSEKQTGEEPGSVSPLEPVRYANALRTVFPAPDEAARAVANFGRFFAPHVDELRAEIEAWYAGRVRYHSLTALLWQLAADFQRRGNDPVFVDFNERTNRTFLRFGIIELAKVLCREVEAARDANPSAIHAA